MSSAAFPETIAQAALQNDCRSVAYTYNDPVVWAEYAIDTAVACKQYGIRSVAVTAGYICDEPRREFFEHMDAANVDLKAFSEAFYRGVTSSHLQPVLDTIRYIKNETNVWLELTNLIIPSANDNPDELRKMCNWILKALGAAVPVHFTAFHPDFRMQDRPRTDSDTLCLAYDIAKSEGLQFPYVGNVHDLRRQTTYCPVCNQPLITRDWHQLTSYNVLSERSQGVKEGCGRCGNCDAFIPGVFEAQPGRWGNKRQPIRIENYDAKYTANNKANHVSSSDASNKHRLPSIDHSLPLANQSETVSTKESQSMSIGANDQSSAAPASQAAVPAPLNVETLNENQKASILKIASQWVSQTARGVPMKVEPGALEELSQRIVMGVFVTLKRGKLLRACCGVLGKPMQLLGAVTSAASRAAKEDTRFAPISPTELDFLDIEVTILGPFRAVEAAGEARADAIQVGKHGLMIQRGQKSGLLLPNVAVERGWDATRFLGAVCGKAGLRDSAWQNDDTKLMTFHGEPMEGELKQYAGQPATQPTAKTLSDEQLQQYAQVAGQNIVAIATGGTPSYVLPGLPDATVNAIVLSMQWTRETPTGQNSDQAAEEQGGDSASETPSQAKQGNALQVSYRPGVALQATLFQMCQRAALMFQQNRFAGQLQVGLSIGVDPALHGYGSLADLEGVNTAERALVVSDASHCGFAFDPSKSPAELLERLRNTLPIGARDGMVHTLDVQSTLPHIISISGPTAVVGKGIRPAAVAGQFYPAEDAARRAAVKDLIPSHPSKASPLAIMVPHAALKYSGKVAAQTWASVEGLDGRTILVVSPKHHRAGVNWSVCPFDKWRLSRNSEFASDTDLINKLSEVDAIQQDAASHKEEHGIEVQLPFLEQLAPAAKIVGLTAQGGSWTDIKQAAEQLAEVLRQLPEMPLLAISSDMNHYASDAENRRRDRLALDALATGDPERLIEVCRENEISMCGLVPAALVLQTLIELGHSPSVTEVAYATSGDAGGDKSQVVGYAGALISG